MFGLIQVIWPLDAAWCMVAVVVCPPSLTIFTHSLILTHSFTHLSIPAAATGGAPACRRPRSRPRCLGPFLLTVLVILTLRSSGEAHARVGV